MDDWLETEAPVISPQEDVQISHSTQHRQTHERQFEDLSLPQSQSYLGTCEDVPPKLTEAHAREKVREFTKTVYKHSLPSW